MTAASLSAFRSPARSAARPASTLLDELLGETPPAADSWPPLPSPGIPEGDGQGPSTGNSLHATAAAARHAAQTEAGRRNAASSRPGGARYRFRVAHHGARQPLDSPHYHVIDEQGRQVSGHFFYGRQPVRHLKKVRPTAPAYDRHTPYPGADPATSYSQYRTEWHGARAAKAQGRQRRQLRKGYELELETGSIPPAASPSAVIHPNIDVHAQYALQRLLASPDLLARADGATLLADVRAGRLRGIYKEDQYVPALWARERDGGWWGLLAPDEDAALLLWADAPNYAALAPPLVVFRDAIRSNAARLDPALRAARQLWLRVQQLKAGNPALTPWQLKSLMTGQPLLNQPPGRSMSAILGVKRVS